MSAPNNKPTLLCVANWDSNVGYAWWLMESFWIKIHAEFSTDYEVIIAYPSISTLPKAIQDSKIRTVEFNFGVKHPRDLTAHINFIKKHEVQAIYFSDRPTSHWSYLFFRFAGVKKIAVHDHTPGDRTTSTGWKKIAKSLRSRLPYINADIAIGATEFVQQRLIHVSCIPAYKCFVAPNGLPALTTPIDAANLNEQFCIPTGHTIIVSTGRATFYKGVDFALEVIARLVHTHHQHHIHYLYCGDGPDIEKFNALAKALNIDKYTSFPGRISNIESTLASCQIAFHPSRGEVGYSLSILEYMRAQLPVVVPNRPSVCEAITDQHDGLVYDAQSHEAATTALLKLISEPALRTQMGARAQQTVANRYSLDNTHDHLINALDTLICRKSRSSGMQEPAR
ncbi:MAG: glycosyltransferase family 4 protein [Cellvibrio sp.]|uniref:glycosyltransferase family 4 protein n=1 Tax=Cellvibrio sp. TaxID=1965322 RepID=UPI002716D013|nr:glycosyltransferase family 4 protein [Cellvibrio sp.]